MVVQYTMCDIDIPYPYLFPYLVLFPFPGLFPYSVSLQESLHYY